MKFGLEVSPDLGRLMAAEIRRGEVAATRSTREAAGELKTRWRGQVTAAGLGTRLANTVRSESYPRRGESMDAAALVFTRAPRIIAAHDEGTTIRSRDGFWLAIPTEAAPRGRGGARLTPGEVERRLGVRLRFIFRSGRTGLLVADGVRIAKSGRAAISRAKTGRNQVTTALFVLVPQVRLPKRLDLDRDTDAIADRLPGRLVRDWPDRGME